MLNDIDKPIEADELWINRDGFIFFALPKIGERPYNIIEVRNEQCVNPYLKGERISTRSLDEHIKLINDYKIKKATIVADDISFVKECPSLTRLSIRPSAEFGEKFDYSPLYGRTFEMLSCMTDAEELAPYKIKASIDYSQINGIKEVVICGKGHNNFEQIDTLENLWIRENKKHKDLKNISKSKGLQDLTIMFSPIKTLDGIEQFRGLKKLHLGYCRVLTDISALCKIAESLEELSIECCGKIQDFSCLFSLKNLQIIHLQGSNELSNIQFMNGMDNLRMVNLAMNVLDGDITPCRKAKCAYITNKRHYNLKDSDLPKFSHPK
ncbi:MAG: hypothetical protein IKV30_01740 [Clostridia bacterium]|nr:hypothetical protein [Clostridia bacterium]